ANPLEKLLSQDEVISSVIPKKRLRELLDPSSHTGRAEEACNEFLKKVVAPILSSKKRPGPSRVRY
ncbi:MAG TPA: hypothetical protein VLY65_01220, partial [Nitrososphaerales archaeon]|nr:hypothetical protein [Nitrososphaerales archaeon]